MAQGRGVRNFQKEGKEREIRFDSWSKARWPNLKTVGMSWGKPHAGFPDRVLHDDKTVICVEVKGEGHAFHAWQREMLTILERLGARVYVATERENASGEFQLHTIHDYVPRRRPQTILRACSKGLKSEAKGKAGTQRSEFLG